MSKEQPTKLVRIPAIVLTCQKYAPLSAHMIEGYETIWPNHPFTFRVPDGSNMREHLGRFGDRIDYVSTREGEERGRFRQTIFDLLSGIDDDEWVYWCMDDKYPISLNVQAHETIIQQLSSLQDVDALQLCRVPFRHDSPLLNKGIQLRVDRYAFHQRRTYHRIWIHQFLRARVLRTLFGNFPEVLAEAREMDDIMEHLLPPSTQRLFVSTASHAVFGESTTRGMLTTNCALSLQRGPGLPDGFQVSPKRRIYGTPQTLLQRLISRCRSYLRRLILSLRRRFPGFARFKSLQ